MNKTYRVKIGIGKDWTTEKKLFFFRSVKNDLEWTQLHDNKNPNIITPINHNYWGDAGGGVGEVVVLKW